MRQLITTTVLCGLLLGSANIGRTEDAKPATPVEKVTYTDHILPILRAKCAACHSADQAKGGLIVDSYTGLMAGGASGEVVTGGDVDGSRLYDLISHKAEPKMPPKEPRMPDEQLAIFKKWIEKDAPWPADKKKQRS